MSGMHACGVMHDYTQYKDHISDIPVQMHLFPCVVIDITFDDITAYTDE